MTDVNFPQDFYCDDVGVWRLKKEKLAELGKPKQTTNEEWLRTLPAEERVKEILSRGFMTDKRTAEEFVEWLKQPHNNV